MAARRGLLDRAHHHPRVFQVGPDDWGWACPCGGHSPRSTRTRPWRAALISSLDHATHLAS